MTWQKTSNIEGIPVGNQGGNCFESAAIHVLNSMFHEGITNMTLVHGIVTGRGAIRGMQFSHAWIEEGEDVIDGKERISKYLYYSVGRIETTYRYSAKEAMEKALESENYGPWDLSSEY